MEQEDIGSRPEPLTDKELETVDFLTFIINKNSLEGS